VRVGKVEDVQVAVVDVVLEDHRDLATVGSERTRLDLPAGESADGTGEGVD
jgi:hypothetical protein